MSKSKETGGFRNEWCFDPRKQKPDREKETEKKEDEKKKSEINEPDK